MDTILFPPCWVFRRILLQWWWSFQWDTTSTSWQLYFAWPAVQRAVPVWGNIVSCPGKINDFFILVHCRHYWNHRRAAPLPPPPPPPPRGLLTLSGCESECETDATNLPTDVSWDMSHMSAPRVPFYRPSVVFDWSLFTRSHVVRLYCLTEVLRNP